MLKSRLDIVQETFGSVLEIALHDVRDWDPKKRQSTLVHLSGDVTGRTVGESPMTDLGLRLLHPKTGKPSEGNYRSTYNKRRIKGTSVLVKDELLARTEKELVETIINREITDDAKRDLGEQFFDYLVQQTDLFRSPHRDIGIRMAAGPLGMTPKYLELVVSEAEEKLRPSGGAT